MRKVIDNTTIWLLEIIRQTNQINSNKSPLLYETLLSVRNITLELEAECYQMFIVNVI